jgi:phosphoglycolate phosphatase-like HAD superfamily hydrolase
VTPREKVKYVKPNTEHLEATLKALEAKPEEAVLVGDGIRDMQCAHELKAISIGLPTGLSTEKQLITSGANYLITSITDLPALIKSINTMSN